MQYDHKTMKIHKNCTIIETLVSEILIENKFSGTSRVDSRIRHQKCFKIMGVSSNSIRLIASYAQLCGGAFTTTVSNLPLIWICHWHQQNYSTRYLLYESLWYLSIPFCVSKAILHFWRSSTPQKSHFFVKFRHLTRATGAPMQNLELTQTFSISYGSSWGFACAKL